MRDAILVTGATGFVGRHLVAALRDRGHRVITHASADGHIARCQLDLTDVAHVIHLAGKSFVPDSWMSPREFYDVNVVGTVNVLDSCRSAQASLTYVSSYVYGRPCTLPITEGHALQPLNPYAHTKMLAEAAVQYFSSQFGVRASIVRPFNIYGPGQDDRFLIPTIVRQALDPRADRIVVQDVRPKRDFLHVRDLVALLLATLSHPKGGIFNAGSGRSVGIPELVALINAIVGRAKPLQPTGAARPEDVFDVVADVSRARTILSWEPRVGLEEGLRETVAWADAQSAALR